MWKVGVGVRYVEGRCRCEGCPVQVAWNASMFSPSVPYTAPDNVTVSVSVHNSTELDVLWSPPSVANGNITGYNVYVDLFNGSALWREEVSDRMFTIRWLAPHQAVGVQVSANTSVGEGPLSSLVKGRTLIGGAYSYKLPDPSSPSLTRLPSSPSPPQRQSTHQDM